MSVKIAATDPNESEEEEEQQQQPERLVPWYELVAAVMVEALEEMKMETTELLYCKDPLTAVLNRLAAPFSLQQQNKSL